mmetsp:Transcript_1618/g.2214  ORF Transcript_1618/g.2214 Transcript_1618/m.2214 type:complete len:329 (+) Transcript_1618:1147-2133(+)
MLAVMMGLVDGVQDFWESAEPNDKDAQITPGSRRTSLRFMDQGQKGFITADDLSALLKLVGTPFTEKELDFMMRSSDGNLRSHSKRVSYDVLMKLLPPICPTSVYKKGDAIYKKGDLDDNFFLIKCGEVDLRMVDMNKQRVFKTMHRGEHFGEVELLTPSSLVPRLNSAYCSSETCEVLSITDELFTYLREPGLLPSLRQTLEHKAQEKVDSFLRANIRMSLPTKSRTLLKGGVVWDQANKKDQVTIVDSGRLVVEYIDGSKREVGPDEYLILRTKNRSKKQNILRVVALEDSKVTDAIASLFFELLERHSMKAAKHHFKNQQDDQSM